MTGTPRKLALAVAAALGLAGAGSAVLAAAADSVPASGRLGFDVIRKGKDIGDYVLTFKRAGNALTVNVSTDVSVKVPVIGVSAYTFQQNSTEKWNGDRLRALASKTNDNGKPHDISVGASSLIPASLWNADIVSSRQVLNTIDGSTDPISVRNLGNDTIATGHGNVQATHYAISGGLNRELWFDGSGRLVHVRFAAEDGSRIDYVLR